MRADIIKAYQANRSEHRGLSAKQALLWAKDATAFAEFMASLEFCSPSILPRRGVPKHASSESYCRGDIALTIWEHDDPDGCHREKIETSREHHSAREFYSGQSDFISLKEAQRFGRNDRSYDMRSAYEEAREYFNYRHSKQEAEILAREQVADIIAEYEGEHQAFGYGVVFYFRDAAMNWIAMPGDEETSGLWGCEGYDSPERACWDNFDMLKLAAEAEALAATHRAARDFAGV